MRTCASLDWSTILKIFLKMCLRMMQLRNSRDLRASWFSFSNERIARTYRRETLISSVYESR